MLPFLSRSSWTALRSQMTMILPEPILREKILPYCRDHSINLGLVSDHLNHFNTVLLLLSEACGGNHVHVAEDRDCRRPRRHSRIPSANPEQPIQRQGGCGTYKAI